jgi:hypothetical protein
MEDQMQSLIGILVREAVKPSATPLPKSASGRLPALLRRPGS